ncbi:MAG: SUMF1/EgtB/PvdO family nonheme iron enzyme [Planctomycetes bacterium]|nr:SUMF1/EgtB/PvdO family nonheme iron enzyme [Planctomycetota bacterium]
MLVAAMATDYDQLFVKAALAKGVLPPEGAHEALERSRKDGDAGAWLLKKGLLTKHLVSVLADEVNRSQMPKVIGNYRVVDKLGHGGMGSVFKAVQLSLQREVALKVMAGRLARNQHWIDRFLAEARAMAAINHPHVLTCFDAGQDKGKLYLAMELMQGGDLVRLVKSRGGRLPVGEALRIVRDCAWGLEAIGRAGLIHRDIKPGNIFLDLAGAAKLGDLGLACFAEAAAEDGTSGGQPLGTPAFMSPEQADADDEVDIRTDIYALGATLYALLTGHPPYEGKNSFAVIARVLQDPVPDARTHTPDLPPAVCALIARAMAKRREDRPATPADLKQLIETTAAALGIALVTPAAPDLAAPSDPPPEENDDPYLSQPSFVAVKAGGSTEPLLDQDSLDLLSESSVQASDTSTPEIAAPDDTTPDGDVAVEGKVRRIGGRPSRPAARAGATMTPVSELPDKPAWIPDWASAWGIDQLDNGAAWIDVSVGSVVQRFRLIRPGTFTMGSPPDEIERQPDETQHQVSFSHPLWMADTPVTQAWWNAVSATQGGLFGRLSHAVRGRHKTRFVGDERPVEQVSWHDCQELCVRLGRVVPGLRARLPTESEWEYAARAGSTTPFSGADRPDDLGWCSLNAVGVSHPVKRKRANAWGLYDLHGNVWEWCDDCYGEYPVVPLRNPVQRHGIYRVCRGGSYVDDPHACRSARRSRIAPDISRPFVGVRLVVEVTIARR